MPERPIFNMHFIWTTTLVSAMGGLLFGYDWVVIGGAKPFYEKFFNLTTPSQVGWAMSSALVGGAGIGLASNLSPMYIAEPVPARAFTYWPSS